MKAPHMRGGKGKKMGARRMGKASKTTKKIRKNQKRYGVAS